MSGLTPLIPKSEFFGIDQPDAPAHLATGGEVPFLKRHFDALHEFALNKSASMPGRDRNFELYHRCKAKLGQLLAVDPNDIAILPSSSHAVQLARYGLDWRPGDNVVVADVEYPSLIYPWPAMIEQGVDMRIVRRRAGQWEVPASDLARHIDGKTRALMVSQVSYLTGERYDLAELAAICANGGGDEGRPRTLLCVDSTHAAGVVPVPAKHADLLWSSGYKWLLSVHGLGVCYLNPEVWTNRLPPFASAQSAAVRFGADEPERFTFHHDAARFETGNPPFIAVATLDSALDAILAIGIDRIEAHAVALSGKVRDGCAKLGYTVMTPADPKRRAGNVCVKVDDPNALRDALAARNVWVWTGDGRARISTHLFNDQTDVDRLLTALAEIRGQFVGAAASSAAD